MSVCPYISKECQRKCVCVCVCVYIQLSVFPVKFRKFGVISRESCCLMLWIMWDILGGIHENNSYSSVEDGYDNFITFSRENEKDNW